jgi:hypothetical protein
MDNSIFSTLIINNMGSPDKSSEKDRSSKTGSQGGTERKSSGSEKKGSGGSQGGGRGGSKDNK